MGYIEDIALVDFRNYRDLHTSFAPGVNIVVGPNGQGKTSLLEAIYFASVLRSFRCRRLRNLVHWGQRRFLLRARIREVTTTRSLEVESGDTRRLILNGSRVAKASDFIGQVFCIAFVPEDIGLVKGSASNRRRYLDSTLSRLYPPYLLLLQDYQKALRSRNALLRRDAPDRAAVAAYDAVLTAAGVKLLALRRRFFHTLTDRLAVAGDLLFGDNAAVTLNVEYAFTSETGTDSWSSADWAAAYLSGFRDSADRDYRYRMTHVGPHRDDFQLLLRDRLLQLYGSEGQCRLAALALKMATGEVFLEAGKKQPVVFLVDDVTGELDPERRRVFFASLTRANQVFFAATDLTALPAEMAAAATHFIDNGTVRRGASGGESNE